MKFALQVAMPPAVLPVFDDSWKAKCLTCRYLGSTARVPMACARTDSVARRGPRTIHACGDARSLDHGGRCGPDAKLWEPCR